MKFLLATLIGSSSLVGYGLYDAYQTRDCATIIDAKEQIYKNHHTGEVTRVVIQRCGKPT